MKLKPCPMCGGPANFKELADQELYVECSRCHLATGFARVEKCDRHDFVAGLWNDRIKANAELREINVELLAALRECLANLAPCNNGPVNRYNCPACRARHGAEKAIAKAEGNPEPEFPL